jgi:hypothetical protein
VAVRNTQQCPGGQDRPAADGGRHGGLKHRVEVGGRLRGQRDGAPDLDEIVGAVAPGDDDFGVVDGAEDAADDDLDGVAVPDLSLGIKRCRALPQ